MSADNRLVPENLHVIPKVSLELSGWPAATDASNVVQSTLAALKLPVIPMRTYRAAGVHTWVVTAQELPKAFRFTLEINKELVEILVQEVSMNQPVRPPAKGKSKGKFKANKGSTYYKKHSLADRLQPGHWKRECPNPLIHHFRTIPRR